MLKIYNSLDEVPESLREHYKLDSGKYVPHLADDHPVLANNRLLLSQKQTVEQERDTARSDAESAKSNGLPRGHKAVPNADAELLEAVKTAGFTSKEQIAQAKANAEELQTRKRQDVQRRAAQSAGYDPEAFVRLPNLPEIEEREAQVEGKTVKQYFAKVKTGENQFTDRPLSEFIEGSEDFRVFMPSLKRESEDSGGFATQGFGEKPQDDRFKRTREAELALIKNQQAPQGGSVADRFYGRQAS